MRTRTALRQALLAALVAPTLACDGSGGEACVVVEPDTLPPYPTLDGSGCASATYEVTITNLDTCSLDASPCEVACKYRGCAQAGSTFTCTETVCGKARASLRRRKRCSNPLVDYLRASTWLEAASIDAFYTLSDELSFHGAPATLVRQARAAGKDERRHARAMAAVARRFGVKTKVPRPHRKKPRKLLAVVLENAREGLVHETFGACVAAFQAERATDPFVRRAMRAIALDEARHAALARRVARWANTKLTAAERARVSRAREKAVARLVHALGAEPPADLVQKLAVPTSIEATAMATALRASLWVD